MIIERPHVGYSGKRGRSLSLLIVGVLASITSLFVLSVLAQTLVSPQSSPQSPADLSIAFANREIQKHPSNPNFHSELAVALIHKARETSDERFFDQAEAAADKSLGFSPNNFEARKAKVAVLLGRNEAAKARLEAQQLNHEVPDDVTVYGYVAEADTMLGDYEDAEKSAQWMLDLRPNNIAGLIRGAQLRKIFGDLDGAVDFLNDAYQQTPPDQTEDLAFLLTEIAGLDLEMGKLQPADQLSEQALKVFADYYLALEMLARVRCAQSKYVEAVELLRKRNERFPQPRSIWAEAEALNRAGKAAESQLLYAEFEHRARAELLRDDNVNVELIFFYLHHKQDAAEALRIARLQTASRHDVFTLDAYASALYSNGNYAEARTQIEKALAPGIRDANIFFHAATICSRLNDGLATRQYLEKSLQANPVSEVSSEVRDMLAKYSAGNSSRH